MVLAKPSTNRLGALASPRPWRTTVLYTPDRLEQELILLW